MAQDTQYAPVEIIYKSKGLVAKYVEDQPPEFFYLDFRNCFERAEDSVSSRYGTQIINRDPNGTPNGANYYFSSPIITLARLIYGGQTYRYGGSAAGILYRRTTDTQGPYTQIYSGLSGEPFSTATTSCEGSSQAYLFIGDANVMLKDNGTFAAPQLWGIDPPNVTANTVPYSLLLVMIARFGESDSYTTDGISDWAWASVNVLSATSGEAVTDFPEFFGISSTGGGVPPFGMVANGMIAVLNTNTSIMEPIATVVASGLTNGLYTTLTVTTVSPHGLSTGAMIALYWTSNDLVDGFYVATVTGANTFTVPYIATTAIGATGGFVTGGATAPTACVIANEYSTPYPPQFSAYGFYQETPTGTTSFPVGAWSGTIAESTVGTISEVLALDLNQNNQITDDDLIVVTLAVDDPNNVSSIVVQFNVGDNSGTNCYQKTISPAYYQPNIAGTESAYEATESQILADTLGLITGQPPNTTSAQLQPANFGTGQGSWATCYLRLGDFLPVGQAGAAGMTWANVAGWEIQITTNTTGSATVSFNGMYLQGGFGPSSYGGVGYDYRYTYFNANTYTESSPSEIQEFSTQYGNLASLAAPIFLRQAAQILGNCSLDPQVTHLRLYRRGGSLSNTWLLLDQIPNVPFGNTVTLTPSLTMSTTGPGTLWTDPGNATSPTLYASVGVVGAGFLNAAISGLVIPSTATNIQIVVTGSAYGASGFHDDLSCFLMLGSEMSASQSTVLLFPAARFTFGLVGWGVPLSPALLNAGFSVVFQPQGTTPQTCHVGDLTVTIAYDDATAFIYKDVIPDASLLEGTPIIEDNDPPVTASLPSPIATTLATATANPATQTPYTVFAAQIITVTDPVTFVVNQVVDLGYATNLEQLTVIAGGVGSFTAIVRLQHNPGEPVNVYSIPRQPCILSAVAFGKVWLAGDDTNPNRLYYSKQGQPENFSPAAYIPVGETNETINIVAFWRGALYVATNVQWYIIQGGASPQAIPTGSQHGAVSKTGWTLTESAIWFRSADGLRSFNGANAQYMSLLIELLYRQNSNAAEMTPVPIADPTQMGSDVMAYYNNDVYDSYISTSNNGQRFRIIYSTVWTRYRYDDVPATAMLWEEDTNTLVTAKEISAGNYAIVQDAIGDYDDGGWSGGYPVQTPINMILQHRYADLGKPHYPKQFNVLETDTNTQGQVLNTVLDFDSGSNITPITLATINTGTNRDKKQLTINAGDGQEAYSMSLIHAIAVTVAPTLYQENIYAALLADYRQSWDTYWIKMGNRNESFLVKQAYFDYTSTAPITVNLYADGSSTAYFTFTLVAEPDRMSVRVLFPAMLMRLFRMVATSTADFQWWNAPKVQWKPIREGIGYADMELPA